MIEKYIERQPDVMRSMRSILVDWMVEVQVSHRWKSGEISGTILIIDGNNNNDWDTGDQHWPSFLPSLPLCCRNLLSWTTRLCTWLWRSWTCTWPRQPSSVTASSWSVPRLYSLLVNLMWVAAATVWWSYISWCVFGLTQLYFSFLFSWDTKKKNSLLYGDLFPS